MTASQFPSLTAFGRLLNLPLAEQERWREWRNAQAESISREAIVAAQPCPLHSCKAIAGMPCQTASGGAAFHGSRWNEYFAVRWFQQGGAR